MHVSSVSHPRMCPHARLGICLKQCRAHARLHEYLWFGVRKSQNCMFVVYFTATSRGLFIGAFVYPECLLHYVFAVGTYGSFSRRFASPAASSFAVSPRLCFNHPTERERDVRQDGNTEPSVPVKFRGQPVKCGARRALPRLLAAAPADSPLLSVSAGRQYCLLFDQAVTWDT